MNDYVLAAKGTTEAIKSVLELGGKLQTDWMMLEAQTADSSQDERSPGVLFDALVQCSHWLNVLNAPLSRLVEKKVPFMALAVQIIDYFQQQQADKMTLIEGTFLLAQCAYLQSFQEFARQSLAPLPSRVSASAEVAEQIQSLAVPASDEEALEVWFCFHESKLAQPFNEILQARLQESGLTAATAWQLTERASRGTFRHLRETAQAVWGGVRRLRGLLQQDYLGELGLYASLDRHLQREIARQPTDKVFDEAFSFEDLYVPLQVQPFGREANPDDLESWVEGWLAREDAKVLLIQAGSGCGKSVFCRMFADKVRQEIHPTWTPISIQLRNIETLGSTFEETLRLNLRGAFVRKNWLTEHNTRYLFFLDGLDESLLTWRTTAELQQLLAQISRFQQDYSGNRGRSDKYHRLILTGQPHALRSLEREMPDNLERVEIVLMDGDRQARWLERWDRAHERELGAGFREFLAGCLPELQELAREPLLLYLLAAMHRDGELTIEKVEALQEGRISEREAPRVLRKAAKARVYRWAINWVLKKQNLGQLDPRNREWPTWLGIEELRAILQETGLCAVQAGREFVRLKAVESRLELATAAALQESNRDPEASYLTSAIATYDRRGGGIVEFTHESFGEFLCAERLVAAMVAWTQKSQKAGQWRQTYALPDEEVWWQVYDLLGYGHLARELLRFVLVLLEEKETVQAGFLTDLGERLQEFYWRWSGGDFIERRRKTLPQRKAASLQEQGIDKGQRAVDIYAGFNALKLLFSLHQRGVSFHPCGDPRTEMLERTRLLRFIGYGMCLGASTFAAELGPFLSRADLREVDLNGADLRAVNFSRANLSRANFNRADLGGSNLSGSNLSGAVLIGASFNRSRLRKTNLIRANLRGASFQAADLRGASLIQAVVGGANFSGAALLEANLRAANLSSADFFRANLDGANLSEADLREAKLREAKLNGSDLGKANLSGANLSRANLSRTNLSVANLREAKLREANLRETNLFKADLFKANLSRANLIGAKLIRASLREADLFKANLGRANLVKADLVGANLIGVDLMGANLRGANLKGAKYSLKETRFPEGFDVRAAKMVCMDD